MKKSVLIVFIASLLVACHSDINLKDIDTTSELEMGLALPVGSVRAKLGDFVNQVRGLYVDSANGGGESGFVRREYLLRFVGLR